MLLLAAIAYAYLCFGTVLVVVSLFISDEDLTVRQKLCYLPVCVVFFPVLLYTMRRTYAEHERHRKLAFRVILNLVVRYKHVQQAHARLHTAVVKDSTITPELKQFAEQLAEHYFLDVVQSMTLPEYTVEAVKRNMVDFIRLSEATKQDKAFSTTPD